MKRKVWIISIVGVIGLGILVFAICKGNDVLSFIGSIASIAAFVWLVIDILLKRDNKKEKEEKKTGEENPKGTEVVDINLPIIVPENAPKNGAPEDENNSEDVVIPQEVMATEEKNSVGEKDKDQIERNLGQHSVFNTCLEVNNNNTYVVRVEYVGESRIDVDIAVEGDDICTLRNSKTHFPLGQGSSFPVTLDKKFDRDDGLSWFTINWSDFGVHSEIIVIDTKSKNIIQKENNGIIHRENSVFNMFLRVFYNNKYVIEVEYIGDSRIYVDIAVEGDDICKLRNSNTHYSLGQGSSFLVTLDKKFDREDGISWFTIKWSDFGNHSEIVKMDTRRKVLTL